MEGFYHQGYELVVNNLYTSELLRGLFLNSTESFGTLRKKKGLPTDFWKWKPVKGIGEPPMINFCEEILMVCRWNDAHKANSTKIVSMLSTKHTGELSPVHTYLTQTQH